MRPESRQVPNVYGLIGQGMAFVVYSNSNFIYLNLDYVEHLFQSSNRELEKGQHRNSKPRIYILCVHKEENHGRYSLWFTDTCFSYC